MSKYLSNIITTIIIIILLVLYYYQNKAHNDTSIPNYKQYAFLQIENSSFVFQTKSIINDKIESFADDNKFTNKIINVQNLSNNNNKLVRNAKEYQNITWSNKENFEKANFIIDIFIRRANDKTCNDINLSNCNAIYIWSTNWIKSWNIYMFDISQNIPLIYQNNWYEWMYIIN